MQLDLKVTYRTSKTHGQFLHFSDEISASLMMESSDLVEDTLTSFARRKCEEHGDYEMPTLTIEAYRPETKERLKYSYQFKRFLTEDEHNKLIADDLWNAPDREDKLNDTSDIKPETIKSERPTVWRPLKIKISLGVFLFVVYALTAILFAIGLLR